MDEKPQKSVCYVLAYYSPNYVRTRTLIKALQNIENLVLFQARNRSTGILRYAETIAKLIKIRLLKNPDFYFLGFRGHEIFWAVRLITLGKPLIFDSLMSPYDSFTNETQAIRKSSIFARLIYSHEKWILHHSDFVLTDTEIHKVFLKETFDVRAEKLHVVPVSSDEDLFQKDHQKNAVDDGRSFCVLFYGSFLPLHGIDIILRAAYLLKNYPIHFTLIGGHKTNLGTFFKTVTELGLQNVSHQKWLNFEELPQAIAQSDVGLGGPFGNSGQARRVVTGKTMQFLSMSKAVIIGEIDQDYGFIDKVNSLVVPQGSEAALAEAIFWAYTHQGKLAKIGRAGYELYNRNFSLKNITAKIQKLLADETTLSEKRYMKV